MLAYDVSRCEPGARECSKQDRCARFTAPWQPDGHQPVSDFTLLIPIFTGCTFFIDNGKEAK